MDSRVRHRLLRRRRRHQPAAGGADRVPDAHRAVVVLGRRGEEGQGVLDLHPRARGGDDRRVRLAGSVPVLRVLGRDADPDVLPDRDLGLRPAHLRGREVHALHDGRQRPDAGRHPGAGLPAQRSDGDVQLRPAEALRARDRAPDAAVVLPGVRRRVRDQGAAVPVPHLAARRARAGADRGVDHPGGRAAEDGHLRAGALRLPALPRRGGSVRAVDRGARRDRHHLRRAGGDGAAGHEEAGGLFVGQPPGLRGAGHLRDEHAGRAGRRLPDAGARRQHRRALPPRRHAVGPPPHPPDRRVRRLAQRDAAPDGHVPDHHAGVDWHAGAQRVRRRVPDDDGRLPVGSAPGGRRRPGRDPVGRLHAGPVPEGLSGRRHQRQERVAARPEPARVGQRGAAVRAGDLHGSVPVGVPEADGAVGAKSRGARAGRPAGARGVAARPAPRSGGRRHRTSGAELASSWRSRR